MSRSGPASSDDEEAKKKERDLIKAREKRLTILEKGLDIAEKRVATRGLPGPIIDLDEHGIPVVVEDRHLMGVCALYQDRWPHCQRLAGTGTLHLGTGPCNTHGGNKSTERAGGAIVTAHAIAAMLDVDPWEAVETAMRRAFAWSSWYNAMLSTVTDNDELRPGGSAYDWVKGAERTTEQTVRYAKIAHDMGIDERRMQAIELEGRMLAQVLSATLHELGLSQDQEERARVILDGQLRQLADQNRAVIVGELAPPVIAPVDASGE